MVDKVPVLPANTTEAITTSEEFFAPGAYWKILSPEEETQNNPVANTPFAEPTDTGRVKVNLHHNFPHLFDRPEFTKTR